MWKPNVFLGRLCRFVFLCYVFLAVGFLSSGCAKVHKMEDESWTIEGADGSVFIEDGEFRFGPKKKNPKDTIVSEYSKNACYFKFKLANRTDRSLQIKTVGELLDRSGIVLQTVITNFHRTLAPGQEDIIESYFGVTQKDVREAVQFKIGVEDVYIE